MNVEILCNGEWTNVGYCGEYLTLSSENSRIVRRRLTIVTTSKLHHQYLVKLSMDSLKQNDVIVMKLSNNAFPMVVQEIYKVIQSRDVYGSKRFEITMDVEVITVSQADNWRNNMTDEERVAKAVKNRLLRSGIKKQ